MGREPLLRTKLLTWLLLPLLLLLLADSFVSYWVALRFSQRAHDRTLLEVAREISLYVRSAGEGPAFEMPDAAREVLFNDPTDTLYFQVATRHGETIAGEPIAPPMRHAQVIGAAETYYDGSINGNPVRIVELSMAGQQPAGPRAVVRVAETTGKRDELTREILLSVVVPQILLIMIAVVVVWAGVVRGLAPLDRVRDAVASRSHRERGPVAVPDIPGEVRPLIDALNGLLARLDKVLLLQSRFVADAAHQLKTPVAGLRAQMELALRETEPQRMREAVSRLYSGLERLARLVSQLLSLARNEPDAVQTVKLRPVDLNALALEAATSWVPEAYRKGIDLGLESASASVTVMGDSGRLRELLENLIDNAVRYTPEGGRVTVRVTADPMPCVAVSDDGPAIPAHERPRVFERFHRLLGTAHEGSGLGLAIALEIAHLHEADITLEDDQDGVGNTFTVSFPHPRGIPAA